MVGERANAATGRAKLACATEERHANRNCGLHGAGRPLPGGRPVGLYSVRTTVLLHALLDSTRQGIRMWPPSGGPFTSGDQRQIKERYGRLSWRPLSFGTGPFPSAPVPFEFEGSPFWVPS
jgi:hypothetical protein